MSKWFRIVPICLLLSFNLGYSQSDFKSPLSFNYQNNRMILNTDANAPDVVNLQYNIPQQEDSPNIVQKTFEPTIYMYLYGGMGFSFLSSSKIKSLLGDDFGIGIGLPTWSWGLIFGYKNIIQAEYNNGISDHDFNNNSIIPDIPSEVIKMDYSTTDWQFKINPFFWNMDKSKAYFIVIGSGDVDWRDENKDGFKGSSVIYGLEYAQFSEFLNWSVSFKRYGITYEETILFNIPFDFETKASDYILEFKVGIGFNI